MIFRPLHHCTAVTFAILLFGLGRGAARAQDTDVPRAVSREGEYAFLYHVVFHPGKSDEGIRILEDSLIPAWSRAGVRVTLLESLVGTRDAWVVVPLRDGPGTFDWVVSPQDAETWAALVERAGSPERANGVMDRFIALVERQSQEFVVLHDPTGETR